MTKWPLFLGFKVPSNPPSDLLARHHPPLCVLNSWQIPYFPGSGSDPTLNSCFWPLHLFLPSIWTHVWIVSIFKTLNNRMGFPMISLHHLDGKLWKNVESLEAFIHDQHFFLNCVPLTLQEGRKRERQRVNTFCKAKAQWAGTPLPASLVCASKANWLVQPKRSCRSPCILLHRDRVHFMRRPAFLGNTILHRRWSSLFLTLIPSMLRNSGHVRVRMQSWAGQIEPLNNTQ